MKTMKKTTLSLISALLLVGSLQAVPVFAHKGNQNDDGTKTEAQVEQEVELHKQEITQKQQEIEDNKNEAKAELEAKVEARKKELEQEKSDKKAATAQERQKRCEQRKANIATRVQRLQTKAGSIQTKLNNYLAGAEKYIADNSITSDDVQTALLAAKDAQAKSATAVTALSNLSPTFDCAKPAVASDIAQVKATAEQAKAALKAYREAVRTLLEKTEGSAS